MLTESQKNIQDLREHFKKEIETLKNRVSEMKHTMEGFKSRLDEVEETVNEIEIREQEYKEAEAQREKRISRNERVVREPCNQSKWNNICIIGAPEEGERETWMESLSEEIMAKNFPNLGKEIVNQAMEVQSSPNTRDPRKTIPRHIIIKMAKVKGKESIESSQREREKRPLKKGKPISYHETSQQKP